jgi:hypothetical protein
MGSFWLLLSVVSRLLWAGDMRQFRPPRDVTRHALWQSLADLDARLSNRDTTLCIGNKGFKTLGVGHRIAIDNLIRIAPQQQFLTGISSFLPDSVRGISATAMIALGTKRGDTAVRIAVLMLSFKTSSQATPGAVTTKIGIKLSRPRYSKSTTRESSTSGSASTA